MDDPKDDEKAPYIKFLDLIGKNPLLALLLLACMAFATIIIVTFLLSGPNLDIDHSDGDKRTKVRTETTR